jgi:MraZ protein
MCFQVWDDPIVTHGTLHPMLFIGTTELNIDAKGRLSIPSRYRARLPEDTQWVSMPWSDGSIRLYTEQTYEELASAWTQSLTPTQDIAELRRRVYSSSEPIEPDTAGRIRIPQKHLDMAEIGSEVVLIGVGKMFEIRNRGPWLAEERKRFVELPELVARTTR